MQELKKKYPPIQYLISACSIAGVVLVWYLVTDVFHLVSPQSLPSPVKVITTFFLKFHAKAPEGSTMWQHIGASLQVALTGYFIGVVIGIPLGILMAWYENVDVFVRPLFDLLRPIPGIAWIPVMIILFGIGLLSKAMVIFLSAFIACVVNAYSGISQTKDVHLWVGEIFGASNWQLLTQIAIPTAIPMIMTGMKVALAGSWSALVAAELIASTKGLGFLIQQSRGIYRPDLIIAGMLAIGIVGASLTWLLTRFERLVTKGEKW
jgi:NitT/TauT family transport system permease protein/taurine transport system permease protein